MIDLRTLRPLDTETMLASVVGSGGMLGRALAARAPADAADDFDADPVPWGDPAAVLLRCGVPSPGPTTDPCVNVNGVDWVEDDSDKPNYRFTTVGRTPAVEVILDNDVVSGAATLADLSSAVATLPQTGQCTDVTDVPPPTQPPAS